MVKVEIHTVQGRKGGRGAYMWCRGGGAGYVQCREGEGYMRCRVGGSGYIRCRGGASLTCGGVPLESGWLARILPPQVPLLRGSPIKGGGQWVLGGGGRGGLQGVSGSGGC